MLFLLRFLRLVVVDIGTQFSVFGQLVVMVLTQIGGLGFMALGTLIALAFNRRISLRERLVLQGINELQLHGGTRYPNAESVVVFTSY